MLIRSVRLCILLAILFTLLWNVPVVYHSPDWTVYTVDIASSPWNSTILKPQSIRADSTATSVSLVSTTAWKPIATELPVISKPSPYGYVFYAAADEYACAALVNIQRLRQLFHTRHQIHVLASPGISPELIQAFKSLNAIVTIQEPPTLPPDSIPYYEGCLLKLVSFRMHQIVPSLRRILVLDADQLILRSLDSLFELPDVDLAAPRAYWIGKDAIASTLLLITLSDRLWDTVSKGMQDMKTGFYDMDLVNKLLGDTVLMLPGTYVTLNSHFEDWNMPKWYHPESKGRKNNLVDEENEKKKANMMDLWRAINELVSADYGSRATSTLLQKRQLSPFTHTVATPTQSLSNPSMTTESNSWRSFDLDETNSVQAPGTTGSELRITTVTPVTILAPTEMVHDTTSTNVKWESPVDTADQSELIGTPGSPPLLDGRVPSPPTLSYEEVIAMTSAAAADPKTQPDQDIEAAQSELLPTEPKPEELAPIPPLTPPSPYDSGTHPLRNDLYDLLHTAYVLHYTAVGKPWQFSVKELKESTPNAHPALYEVLQQWREEARNVCPPIKIELPEAREDDLGNVEKEVWHYFVDEV